MGDLDEPTEVDVSVLFTSCYNHSGFAAAAVCAPCRHVGRVVVRPPVPPKKYRKILSVSNGSGFQADQPYIAFFFSFACVSFSFFSHNVINFAWHSSGYAGFDGSEQIPLLALCVELTDSRANGCHWCGRKGPDDVNMDKTNILWRRTNTQSSQWPTNTAMIFSVLYHFACSPLAHFREWMMAVQNRYVPFFGPNIMNNEQQCH